MIAATLLIISAIFALIGCASLALSLPRNWRSVTSVPLAEQSGAIVRRSGWLALSLALVACIWRDGASFAALTWPLLFALGAFSVAMALSYRPMLLRIVARCYPTFAASPSDPAEE